MQANADADADAFSNKTSEYNCEDTNIITNHSCQTIL